MIINEYIENGGVQRDKIAMDIKYRKLTRPDIDKLCSNPQIKDAFIGNSYADKKPKQYWNKSYLDLLSCAVAAESFNRDYLLYLDEVADFVSRAKYKKIIIAGVVIVLVIIAGVIVFSYYYAHKDALGYRFNQNDYTQRSAAVPQNLNMNDYIQSSVTVPQSLNINSR